MSLQQDLLETKLLGKPQHTLTPDMMDYLVIATNDALAALQDQTPEDVEGLAEERQRLDRELSNLVAFVATGDRSPRVRQEFRAREQRLAELDRDLERLRNATPPAPLQVDRAWIASRCTTSPRC
jgi:hypothetical protein